MVELARRVATASYGGDNFTYTSNAVTGVITEMSS